MQVSIQAARLARQGKAAVACYVLCDIGFMVVLEQLFAVEGLLGCNNGLWRRPGVLPRPKPTLIAPGGPYSAGSCSSADGYGDDCSLLRLVTVLCSFLLLCCYAADALMLSLSLFLTRYAIAFSRRPRNLQLRQRRSQTHLFARVVSAQDVLRRMDSWQARLD